MKKILVAKLRHHGDVLLTSPVFTALRSAYPESEIHAYIYAETLPMLEGHPAISHFHLYDRKKKSLMYEAALLRAIRKEGYDLVINLTEGDRGAMAAFASGAKVRVGVDPKGSGMWGKGKIYTHTIRECPGIRHTVEMNLDALRTIGIFPSVDERHLSLAIPDEAQVRADELLEGIDGPFTLVHPVSRWMFKAWPARHVKALLEKLEGPVVLTGGPAKEERDFLDQLGHPHLGGQTSLKELGALIARAEKLITVDSVPMHMAAALKTPLVAIFGPTSEKRWGPWQHSQSEIVKLDLPCRPCYMPGCAGSRVSDCLEALPVEKVLEAIQSLKLSPR
ncbi:MAG: putative lipopolysaccharide heptosyltransferase III [Simkaniaceae bacterium]|nr:putative lipopolysaccharide heptosyltransferase III [Simkaniaceae bacterium]